MPRLLLILLILLLLVGCGLAGSDAPTLTWRATIIDAQTQQSVTGDIFVDSQPVAIQVKQADIPVPSDGEPHELKVIADGYAEWSVTLRGETNPGRVLHGPVKLRRAGPGGTVAWR